MRRLIHDTQGWHLGDDGKRTRLGLDDEAVFEETCLANDLLLHILRKLEQEPRRESSKLKIRHFYRRRSGDHAFVEGSQIYNVIASGIFSKEEGAIHRLLSDGYQEEEGAEQ